MDWSNERWIRLYTRDTATWSLLSWQARACFVLLMRKVDRSGVVDVPNGFDPATAIARLIDVPLEVVAHALDELARLNVVELTESACAVPNFIEAQEARASDRERQAKRRERLASKRKRADSSILHNSCSPDSHDKSDVKKPGRQRSFDYSNPHNSCSPDSNDRNASRSVTDPEVETRSTPPSVASFEDDVSQPGIVSRLVTLETRQDETRQDQQRTLSRETIVCGETAEPNRQRLGQIVPESNIVELRTVAASTALDVHSAPSSLATLNPARTSTPGDATALRGSQALGVLPPNAFLADFAYLWQAQIQSLETELGRKLRPPIPWGRGEKVQGIADALETHGAEVVSRVLLHELRTWARTDPNDSTTLRRRAAFLSRLFVGDGFSAAHARWSETEAVWDVASQ